LRDSETACNKKEASRIRRGKIPAPGQRRRNLKVMNAFVDSCNDVEIIFVGERINDEAGNNTQPTKDGRENHGKKHKHVAGSNIKDSESPVIRKK